MAGIESLLIGRVLGGRYRIEEVIGRGGMGAVYRAVDERLGRQVALKVITASGTGEPEARERLRARFFREARSAAALPHHPNVVPVYDYGSDEALGLDYLVMELLRGSDLATRLVRSGAPALAASLRILVEAARGLAVGHQQGLIHRDVKPGNIFLTRTHNDDVQVRVVDFGIAKLADEDTLAQLTVDGRVPHSPAYASPEQLRGLNHLTPAADVFGLGAVGFQLLTGDRPYTESDRNRMSLGMPVTPPSIRDRNPAVPASVEAVILRALAYDPQDRYADAGEMGSALETAMRALAEMPIDPYLGGATIITATDLPSVETPRTEQEDERTQLADVSADDHTLLAPVPAAATVTRKPAPGPVRPRQDLPPRPPMEDRGGGGGKLVWFLVVVALGAAGIWGWQAMLDGGRLAEEVIEPDTTQVVATDTLVDSLAIRVAEALDINRDGVIAYEAGRYQEALRHFERAVELFPDSATYRRNYGYALFLVGQPEEALFELRLARTLDPSVALTYANLGQVQLELGDTTAAVASYEEYLLRETDPEYRAVAEGILREIEVARNPDLPLLGQPVPGRPPGDPRPPPDSQTSPVLPGG